MGLNLLLVEDDALFAGAFAEDLRALGHGVTIAGDGRAALAILGDTPFDAIVLDRVMPRMDGMALLETLRGRGMTVPIVMLTALAATIEKIEALDLGADDYCVKPLAAAELAARIRAILRGRRWTTTGTDTVKAGDIVVSPSSHRAWRGGVPVDLARQELLLLAELVRHAGQVLTRTMLIGRAWGYGSTPDTNIVDVYIRRLRVKLIDAGGADPIKTVRGVGYVLRG